MQEAQNTKLVQDAYAAFGRGDIPALLAMVDDDVTWQPVIGAGKHVPTNGARKGKASVGEFFKILGQSVTFTTFEPREFIAQGDKVAVLGHYAAKAVSTGRGFDSDWMMLFTLKNGKMVDFKEFTDPGHNRRPIDRYIAFEIVKRSGTGGSDALGGTNCARHRHPGDRHCRGRDSALHKHGQSSSKHDPA